MIVKKLKYGTFTWDDERKEFHFEIQDKKTGIVKSIELDKIYAFALMRFILRVSQRNWLRRKK